MARRNRINLPAIFKPLTGCAVIVLFLWFLSSGLQPGIQIFLSAVLITWLIAFVVLLCHRARINSAIRERKNRMSKWMPQN
jgi:hypothetical protein